MKHAFGRTTSLVIALSLAGTSSATGKGGHKKEVGPVEYRGSVEVVPANKKQTARCDARWASGDPCYLRGVVFEDRNRDGRRQRREKGIRGVRVSNGLDIVVTDKRGRYKLPVYDQPGGTTLFVTKPASYALPVDDTNVPQFFYHHVPEGSPTLRFGGLPATGALPRAVNFPMVRTRKKDRFKIVVSGDTQSYSNNEVGYVRDSLAAEVAKMDDVELVMIEGDVMGDDLGLFPRFKSIMSLTGTQLYMVGGNHDLDFDAATDNHSFDTLRREWGPTYYSFEIGDVHFIGLDNVRYPCTPEIDNADGLHSFCDDPVNSPAYNGRIDARQMEWLARDIELTSKRKLIVLNMHIPLVTYIDQFATRHQTDNVAEVYALLEGRKALAFSGHTHTIEQIRPGEEYEGWNTAFSEPIGPAAFPQIVAGASSGSWWSGDFDFDNLPRSTQRLGAPRGFFVLEFDGNDYRDTFKASGQPLDRQMSISFLSPTFRTWYDQLFAWASTPQGDRSEVAPVGIGDLPDPSILTAGDLAGGVQLVANVWNGSSDSQVWAHFDNGDLVEMTRTQTGTGEGFVPALDPWALERQLYSLRYAARSESGDPRAQGFELFRGSRFEGEAQPLPTWTLTNRSIHLWNAALPQDLDPGAHLVRVVTVDHAGEHFEEMIPFEIMEERPPAFFRSEVFE